ncbi:MAG: hopanoid-associated sugar epimerase [Alphaproteobacteria bacterium]
MSVLVTGASGFVGAAVVRALLDRGERVRVMTRPASDRRNIEGLDVEVVHGDLDDPDSLAEAVRGMRALYHVAADYRLWVRDPRVLYRTNVDGTVALMRAAMAAGVERVVYTSSVATLGLNADGTPAHEETPVSLAHMVGHYKRSKYLAEEAVQRLVREEGLPAVIVNPSTPVGPRDVKPTPTGRMIYEAATGRMPAYVDTGLNVVHVDDVAAGHLLAFAKGETGRRYILGGEDLELREILAQIARLTGRPAPKVRLPRTPLYPLAVAAEGWARLAGGGEPMLTVDALKMARKKMFFSSARAREALGYAPRPAGEALRDAIEWFGVPLADGA